MRLTVVDHPLRADSRAVAQPEGWTVAEHVAAAAPAYQDHVVAFVGGRVVPREWWSRVRPKGGTLLELRAVPQGGGGKGILRTLLTVAVIGASLLAPAAAGLLGVSGATLGTSIVGSFTVGNLLTSVVAFGGLLAVNALVPNRPPKLGDLSGAGGSPTLFLEGARNRSRPFEVVPVVLGRYRETPPFGAQPITETLGGDQYLRLLFVWGIGPLEIDPDSIRIGDTALSSFEGVTIEHREGRDDDEPLTLYGAGGSEGSGSETISEETLSVVLEPGTQRFGFSPPTGGTSGPIPTPPTPANYFWVEFFNESNLGSWSTRTTGANANAISVDVTFPSGLAYVGATGEFENNYVMVQVQFRKVGDPDWIGLWGHQQAAFGGEGTGFSYDPTDPGYREYAEASFTELDIIGDGFTVDRFFVSTTDFTPPILIPDGQLGFVYEAASTQPLRFGLRWPTPETAQYEVRLRAVVSNGPDDTSSIDTVVWSAIRTIRDGDPIQTGAGGGAAIPLARSALQIKATDQLNGVVDELSGIVRSYAPVWTGSSWLDDQPTNNPASLFRLVLQGNGNAAPLPDSRLDLDTLAEWYDFCEDNGLAFNMVRDFASSVWETLADVAAAGRASPTEVDGKWSVVIEREQSVPVSHVTPRNSHDFNIERAYVTPPHAWRIRFPNEDEDYRQDERRVYVDGQTAETATRFEALELPGVTDPDQVQRLGRFRIVQGAAQTERWTWQQDMEFLTYRRGDRVAVTHDVLQVGLASARVRDVVVDSSNDVVSVELDEVVPMSAGTDYGVAVRTVAGGQVTAQVVTVDGESAELTFSTPVPAVGGEAAISEGDLLAFGELGSETDDATVISIQPESDFRARVVGVPYRPVIFDTDSETIPEFDTNLTPIPAIPAPTVTSVESGTALLARGAGNSVRARVGVEFEPFDVSGVREDAVLDVQSRRSGTSKPYTEELSVEAETTSAVVLTGVQSGEAWDIRLRWRLPSTRRLPGPWTNLTHTVVGKDEPPGNLEGLTLSAFGGQAFLRWDLPAELDVVLGGSVRFRHSPLLSGAQWAESTSIGQAAQSTALFAVLPLKPGTYLARVFDSSGNPSTGVSTVTTKQASVLEYASAGSLDEDPTFGGVHSGTVGIDGVLKLDGDGLFDDEPDVDAIVNFDTLGGTGLSGTYEFQFGFDLGSETRVRLTTRVAAQSVNVLDLIDAREDPIDDWEDFDGTLQAQADAIVQVRHTDDDPASSSPDWSSWERLDSAEFDARGFDFRAILSTNDPAFNVHVTDLGVDAEVLA